MLDFFSGVGLFPIAMGYCGCVRSHVVTNTANSPVSAAILQSSGLELVLLRYV